MQAKSKTILTLTGVAAVVAVAAGVYIMMNPWSLTKTQQLILGFVCLVVGLLYAVSPKRSWTGVMAVIIFGFYQLGRASGKIEHAFFRYLIGLPLIALGLYAIYKLLEIIFPDSENGLQA